MIFRKRFKNSWRNDTLTLPATRCMIPSSVAKKIFKSPHHARRRIKNQIPMIFVASVINSELTKASTGPWPNQEVVIFFAVTARGMCYIIIEFMKTVHRL